MIQEAFFTELPQVSKEYYDHGPQWVGFFLWLSTFYVIPTALLGVYLSKKMPDRHILIIATIIYIIGTVMKINFEFDKPMPQGQYYVGSCILFIGSLMTEASTVAILAKVISPSLKMGFFNAGLLSGTGDTLGRALGNSSFTLFASFGSKSSATETGEGFDYGIRAYSFYWYITATALLIISLITTIIFLPKLQKYTVITIEQNDDDEDLAMMDRSLNDKEKRHMTNAR